MLYFTQYVGLKKNLEGASSLGKNETISNFCKAAFAVSSPDSYNFLLSLGQAWVDFEVVARFFHLGQVQNRV